MSEEWLDTPEDDGITLGPEEALEREIAKSKALKVERLKLKDQVERLTDQNRSLHDQLEGLKQSQGSLPDSLEHSPDTRQAGSPQPTDRFLPNRWAFFLLVFNLTAIGLLLIYLLQKPTP